MANSLFAEEKSNSCLDCHAGLDGSYKIAEETWGVDIHKAKGFGCVDCHGGDAKSLDPAQAMSRSRGFTGTPRGMGIIQVCGKCHSDATLMKRFNPAQRIDQVSEYFTSNHGKQLRRGDKNVATCISCHSVHDIRLVSDPRAKVYPLNVAETCGVCHSNAQLMAPYGIKTNQKDEYLKSVHYEALTKQGDLSAPTCNKCHGNHGATPPGVVSVANVCGQCHAVFADLFDKSPHKDPFTRKKPPACLYCHGNHGIQKPTDEMLGVSQNSLCVECHSSGKKGHLEVKSMRDGIDHLKSSVVASEAVLTEAEHKGMEVSQAKYELIEGRQSLTKARTQVHSFNESSVKEFTDAGMKISIRTLEKGKQALQEYQFRRKGLAISLLIILGVIVGLYFKIRDIERRQSEK